MTRAGPSDAAALGDVAVEQKLLADGEVILLSIKPSRWFVLLTSIPVVVLAAFVAGGAAAAQYAGSLPEKYEIVYILSAAAVLVRLVAACVQWMGLRYVLTDRRILRLRTLPATTVFELPLEVVAEAGVSASPPEKLVGCGSVVFLGEDRRSVGVAWVSVANPRQVARTVDEAVERHRRYFPTQNREKI
jgi:hypothetical protein